MAVILHFSIYKNRITSLVVPHMNAERLYPLLCCCYEFNRSVDAKRLASFRESPLSRTSTTHPRHVGYHLRMLHLNLNFIVSIP